MLRQSVWITAFGLFCGMALVLAGCQSDVAESESITPPVIVPDGRFDGSFKGNGFLSFNSPTSGMDVGMAVAIDADNRVLIAGAYSSPSGVQMAVWRLLPNGQADLAFGSGGIAYSVNPSANQDRAEAILVQSDGKIVIVGRRWNGATFDMGLVRFHSNGAVDNLVWDAGPASGDAVGSAVAVDGGGRYVVVGTGRHASQFDNIVVWRFHTALTPDGTFGTTGLVDFDVAGSNDRGIGVAVIPGSPTEKILVAGHDGGSVIYLTQLDDVGAQDTGFNAGNGYVTHTGLGSGAFARAMVRQSGGKIVVAGESSSGGDFDAYLWRFSATGIPDTFFGSAGAVRVVDPVTPGQNDSFRAVTKDAKGRLVLAGLTSSTPSETFFMRFSANGGKDNGFGNSNGVLMNGTLPVGAGPQPHGITVAPNGAYLATGESVSADRMVVWKIK